jgi:hypothetical protein
VKQDDKKGTKADRLRALVESYGTSPERWPDGEKPSPEELEVASSEPPAWLAEQRQIDERLDGIEDVVPSAVLLRRVAEIPVRHPKGLGAWRGGWLRNVVAAAAAAAALGLVVGMTTPESVAVDDAAADWDDFSTLALGVDVSEELLP